MGEQIESKVDMRRRVHDLQSQVDELKELVNTLLSVIWKNRMECIQVQHQPSLVKA